MCVGIPVRLTGVDGIIGRAANGDVLEMVDLSLLPEARPGDWVLAFLGTGHAIVAEDDALKIRAALSALSSLMTGGEIGDAFADLEDREPQLPPHLQAAQDAGHSQG